MSNTNNHEFGVNWVCQVLVKEISTNVLKSGTINVLKKVSSFPNDYWDNAKSRIVMS